MTNITETFLAKILNDVKMHIRVVTGSDDEVGANVELGQMQTALERCLDIDGRFRHHLNSKEAIVEALEQLNARPLVGVSPSDSENEGGAVRPPPQRRPVCHHSHKWRILT